MIEKIKKYVKTAIAGVLALSLVLQAFHGMQYVLANEETTGPETYTVTLNQASRVFICNKEEPTTYPITLTYTVDDSTTPTLMQNGVIATTDPGESYPYLNGKGHMKYQTGRLWTYKVGATYTVNMSLDGEGKVDYTAERTLSGVTDDLSTRLTTPLGTAQTSATYFGIWMAKASSEDSENAVLTNVSCVDAAGNDLGVKVTTDATCTVVKDEIEEPEEPTGLETYTVVLNQASRVFICNKEAPTTYPITLTYTVDDSTTRNLYQNGVMATTTPDEPYPFSSSTGYLKHRGYARLWTYQLGATYKVTLDLTDTGDITTNIERTLADGNQSNPTNNFDYSEGTPLPDATHLGIWIARHGAQGAEVYDNAVLTNVSCVDAAGNDLGVKVTTDAACEVVKNETVTLDAKYETYGALPYLLSGTGDLTVNGEAKENECTLTQVGDYEIQWDYYGKITKQKIVIYQLGNAHLDENIDVCDLVAIKKEADEHYLDTEAAMLGADVNDSKTVDDVDVTTMRKVLVGTATLDEPVAVSYALNDASVMPIAGYYGPCG